MQVGKIFFSYTDFTLISYFRNSSSVVMLVFQADKIWTAVSITDNKKRRSNFNFKKFKSLCGSARGGGATMQDSRLAMRTTAPDGAAERMQRDWERETACKERERERVK